MPDIFEITQPSGTPAPLILSIPHSGTYIPEDISKKMKPEIVDGLEDTDWFVDQLYDFASELGITTIKANYSRYVIDLNRSPKNQALYSDGRTITGLVPLKTFSQKDIYEFEISKEEIDRRYKAYFLPYHEKVQSLLGEKKSQFKNVILFDAHSIKRNVKSIREEPFPDMILGSADEKSASQILTQKAWSVLSNSDFKAQHNDPFKGGYITRSFGLPEKNQHALQLELSQEIYMNETTKTYDENLAEKLRKTLHSLLSELVRGAIDVD